MDSFDVVQMINMTGCVMAHVKHNATGIEYAAKQMDSNADATREAELLLSLSHQNIIECYGIVNESVLMLELMQMNLSNCVRFFQLSRQAIQSIMKQILEAVSYLHDNTSMIK